MRIGIFGGAFNPIHYGHLRAAEEVNEIFALDKILFIPSGRPPFKKPALLQARHRYEMTRLAIEGNPSFGISDIEVKKRGVSYSIDTLRSLRDKYKGAEFFFILGIDAFLDLPSWKEPDKLLRLINLIVISRAGFSFLDLSSSIYLIGDSFRKGVSRKTLRELDKGLRDTFSFSIYPHTQNAPPFKAPHPSGNGMVGYREKKVFLCKIAGLGISASCLRSIIKAGKGIKYLLPQAVESYIISHKLYKGGRP